MCIHEQGHPDVSTRLFTLIDTHVHLAGRGGRENGQAHSGS
jgi:hypothetical protein